MIINSSPDEGQATLTPSDIVDHCEAEAHEALAKATCKDCVNFSTANCKARGLTQDDPNSPACLPGDGFIARATDDLKEGAEKKKGQKTPTETLYNGYVLPTAGLPTPFVNLCEHIATRSNVPTEVTLASALTIAGAAIGAHVSNTLGGFSNLPSLHTMVVAPSASGKTKPLKVLMEPLFDIDRELIADYGKKLEEWRTVNAKAANPAPKPPKTQIVCAASTDAARAEFVLDNPRGGIMFRDELRAFFKTLSGKFNESAVERMIEITNCDSVKVHTKGEDEIKLNRNSFLSILGGVQNDVLPDTIKPEFIHNGLLHRFFVVMFDIDGLAEAGQDIEPAQIAYWHSLVKSLHSLGNIVWNYLPNQDAAQAYKEEHEAWRRGLTPNSEDSREFNAFKRQAYAKTLPIIHRLALIAHCLKIVTEAPTYPHIHPDMDADTIRWAFSCAPYILTQKLNIYNLIVGEQKPPTDAELVRMIAARMKRKGAELNQTKLGEALGIDRANINRYLKY